MKIYNSRDRQVGNSGRSASRIARVIFALKNPSHFHLEGAFDCAQQDVPLSAFSFLDYPDPGN
jgi:hypothetical protein